jgi:hypothetical protein
MVCCRIKPLYAIREIQVVSSLQTLVLAGVVVGQTSFCSIMASIAISRHANEVVGKLRANILRIGHHSIR